MIMALSSKDRAANSMRKEESALPYGSPDVRIRGIKD